MNQLLINSYRRAIHRLKISAGQKESKNLSVSDQIDIELVNNPEAVMNLVYVLLSRDDKFIKQMYKDGFKNINDLFDIEVVRNLPLSTTQQTIVTKVVDVYSKANDNLNKRAETVPAVKEFMLAYF